MSDTIHKNIPHGPYCYELTGNTVFKNQIINENGDLITTDKPYPFPEMKYCPYFTTKNNEAYCSYLKTSDGLLFDSVKECGINDE